MLRQFAPFLQMALVGCFVRHARRLIAVRSECTCLEIGLRRRRADPKRGPGHTSGAGVGFAAPSPRS
jgi:hypothetical protein